METLLPIEQKEHPIESIMDSTFGKIRALTDADTIVGEPIIMPDGTSIIPISKISVGVVSGGGEYGKKMIDYPFAGASGAGMSIAPICFLVCDGKSVKMLSVGAKSPLDTIMHTVPEAIGAFFGKKK